jgi:hypothetical protein
MESVKEATLIASLLYDKSQYFGKHYIFPSQEKWVEWIYNYGARRISRRTINRWFAILESHGIIKRIRRVASDKRGNIKFATTLYGLGSAGISLLARIGYISFREMKLYIKNSMPFRNKSEQKKLRQLPKVREKTNTPFNSMGEIIEGIKAGIAPREE